MPRALKAFDQVKYYITLLIIQQKGSEARLHLNLNFVKLIDSTPFGIDIKSATDIESNKKNTKAYKTHSLACHWYKTKTLNLLAHAQSENQDISSLESENQESS